jgi:hypothetical protein
MRPVIKEARRLTVSTNSPKTSLFKETFTGTTVIRAFEKESDF